MSDNIPTQIQPEIDPVNPIAGDTIYGYYILEEPSSPSTAPENAVEKVQYMRQGEHSQQYLHDDYTDFRQPWGYVTYKRQLSFTEIYDYKLLHFDPALRTLYDLWISFGRSKAKMITFIKTYFKAMDDDPDGSRAKLVFKLASSDWTLLKVLKEIETIK